VNCPDLFTKPAVFRLVTLVTWTMASGIMPCKDLLDRKACQLKKHIPEILKQHIISIIPQYYGKEEI
jgi:ribonuclease HIII